MLKNGIELPTILVQGKSLSAFRDAGDSDYGNYAVGTISGTDLTFGTKTRFNAASTNKITLSYNSTEKVTFIGYNDVGNSSRITGSALQNSASNISDFIGLADAAISDTATGKINVKGSINSKQTSLTIGSDYYVQSDGTCHYVQAQALHSQDRTGCHCHNN